MSRNRLCEIWTSWKDPDHGVLDVAGLPTLGKALVFEDWCSEPEEWDKKKAI